MVIPSKVYSSTLVKIMESEVAIGWRKVSKSSDVKLFIAGEVLGFDNHDILREFFKVEPTFEKITALLRKFKGHFGLIYQDNTKTVAATDCVSSYPIFYKLAGSKMIVSSSGQTLISGEKIDNAQSQALMFSGYTVGNRTIYSNVDILGHGEILLNKKGSNIAISHYYKFSPWTQPKCDEPKTLKTDLCDLTLRIMGEVIDKADGRIIGVPLSAGVDSRLIVSALRELGAQNVRCYSYGTKGNFEANVAKKVATKLGYKWKFVELSPRKQKLFWDTGLPQEFAEKTNDFISAPVHHDLLVTSSLLKSGFIDDSTLIVNGNSGDFISGNHLPKKLIDDLCSLNLDNMLEIFVEKHFKMWGTSLSPEQKTIFNSLLTDQLHKIEGAIQELNLASLYEYLEMTNRQSKWVIKRQKIYDFFDLNWSLPLWEREYMTFWESVPLNLKEGQKLYLEMLQEQNWGGVWNSIPGNDARYVSPNWMRYLVRPAMKGLCLPFGKNYWHRIEKRFLDYWMDEFGFYGPFGYFNVAMEKNEFRNCLSFHIREYVSKITRDDAEH